MSDKQLDIRSIFGEAISLASPEERAAYLDRVCGDDRDLREEVEALLRANNDPSDFLGGTSPGQEDATVPPSDSPTVDHWFQAPRPDEIASRFPHLEIIELLGEGGMGAVYKARQPKLDRFVALKVLPPKFGKDPTFARRFSREAQALARLNHPGIVTVHDFGDADGLFYLLMEYVDGANLRQTLRAGRIEPEHALQIVPQICEALQFAHDEGIVHRDVKPENVLIDKRGRVKIADFGLAKLLGSDPSEQRLTITQQVMGTPHYMAPEQVSDPFRVDHRADIFSLGVVFYELLTGELPLGRFDPPSSKAQIAKGLDEVVMRTLEREPDRRYQKVSALKTDIESASKGGGTVERPPKALPAIPQPVPVGKPSMGTDKEQAEREERIGLAKGRLQWPGLALIIIGALNIAVLCAGPSFFLVSWTSLEREPDFYGETLPEPDFYGETLPDYEHSPSINESMEAPSIEMRPLPGDEVKQSLDDPPDTCHVHLVSGPRQAASVPALFFFGMMELLIIVSFVHVPLSVMMIVGGALIRGMVAYPLCVIGAVAAMLPCSLLFFFSLPIGIWALVVLTRGEVRDGFDARRGRPGVRRPLT